MPSRKAKRMLGVMRNNRQFFQTVGAAALEKISLPDEAVARLTVHGTRGRMLRSAQLPAMIVTPRRVASPDAMLLHLHGGAYVSGNLLQARMLISPIVHQARIPALTFAYRLAPEHPYPAQLEDALLAFRLLRQNGVSADRIALVGESAGGNLALALVKCLRSLGEPLPAALCLLSPWTDLAQTGESYQTKREIDPTLDAESLMKAALSFAGGDAARLADPDLSFIHADFTGFPRTQIHVGDSELLLSDSKTLLAAMLRDGASATLFRWEGMCHVFQAYGFSESRASIKTMGDFLLDALAGDRHARLRESRFR